MTDSAPDPSVPLSPDSPSSHLSPEFPRWAFLIPWVSLWALELPLQVTQWGFTLSKYGWLGPVFALAVYVALAIAAATIGWLPALLIKSRYGPSGWLFRWATVLGWGIAGLGSPICLALFPDAIPLWWKSMIALVIAALAGWLGGMVTIWIIERGGAIGLPLEGDLRVRATKVLAALPLVALIAGMGHCWEDLTPPRPGNPDKPNVLLVTMDTVNIARVSAYGYPLDTTPTLKRLASEGVMFTQAYAHVPLTEPSHATIFTGLQPQALGVYENARPLRFDVVTLAEAFRGQGFFTAGIPSSRVMRERYYIHQGFDRYPERSGDHGWKSLPWARLLPLRCYYQVFNGQKDLTAIVDDARLTNERALEAIDFAEHRSWFCWVHYYDPHAPYTLPKGDRAKYYLQPPTTPGFDPDKLGRITQLMNMSYYGLSSLLGPCFMHDNGIVPLIAAPSEIEDLRRTYDAQLKYTDEHLGLLLDDLKARGELDNTLVVVTADHGEGLFDRAYFGHNYFLHQDEVHIPLIVWWPSQIKPATIDTPVALSDLYPTILDLLHIAPPEHWKAAKEAWRGHDLAPWLRGTTTPKPYGPILLQQFTFSRAMIEPDGNKLIYQAVMGETPYAVNPWPGPKWLWYDLAHDPVEADNLADGYPNLPEDAYRQFSKQQGFLEILTTGIEGAGVNDLSYQAYLALAVPPDELAALKGLGYFGGGAGGGGATRSQAECIDPMTYTPDAARQAQWERTKPNEH
ncbi:MAG: sulfatase-like hydrolase/transferase [bacterium]